MSSASFSRSDASTVASKWSKMRPFIACSCPRIVRATRAVSSSPARSATRHRYSYAASSIAS
jgi:hypothetical protein